MMKNVSAFFFGVPPGGHEEPLCAPQAGLQLCKEKKDSAQAHMRALAGNAAGA